MGLNVFLMILKQEQQSQQEVIDE